MKKLTKNVQKSTQILLSTRRNCGRRSLVAGSARSIAWSLLITPRLGGVPDSISGASGRLSAFLEILTQSLDSASMTRRVRPGMWLSASSRFVSANQFNFRPAKRSKRSAPPFSGPWLSFPPKMPNAFRSGCSGWGRVSGTLSHISRLLVDTGKFKSFTYNW
jgi:hypothetical protein